MNEEILKEIMGELSEERPLFHSEADFQFALALAIEKHYRDEADKKVEIRLERCIAIEKDNKGNPKSWYIDIWVDLGGTIHPIELKYKTRGEKKAIQAVAVEGKREKYRLKNQGANDVGRFDYLWDIHRIEQISKLAKSDKVKFGEEAGEEFGEGYAIILTNDHLYWEEPLSEPKTSCKAFRIHEGVETKIEMRWFDTDCKEESDEVAEKVAEKRGRKNNPKIQLNNKYIIRWQKYSKLDDDSNEKDGKTLKYTIATIKK